MVTINLPVSYCKHRELSTLYKMRGVEITLNAINSIILSLIHTPIKLSERKQLGATKHK